MDPILLVLLFSSGAALAGSLGVLPLLRRPRPPKAWMGWGNAVAGGAMLGAAYALSRSVDESLILAGGGVLGVLFTHWTHSVSRTETLDLNLLEEGDATYGYRIFLVSTLHSGTEGVAIGAAMAADLGFGAFMALAIAAHNVAESGVLVAVLRGQGLSLLQGTGLAVAANLTQVLLAVTLYAVAGAAPAILPWAAGFAMGGMVNLVLVELLPESYRQAGRTSIALIGALALATVLLVQGALA